jgi:hypothetical protein
MQGLMMTAEFLDMLGHASVALTHRDADYFELRECSSPVSALAAMHAPFWS